MAFVAAVRTSCSMSFSKSANGCSMKFAIMSAPRPSQSFAKLSATFNRTLHDRSSRAPTMMFKMCCFAASGSPLKWFETKFVDTSTHEERMMSWVSSAAKLRYVGITSATQLCLSTTFTNSPRWCAADLRTMGVSSAASPLKIFRSSALFASLTFTYTAGKRPHTERRAVNHSALASRISTGSTSCCTFTRPFSHIALIPLMAFSRMTVSSWYASHSTGDSTAMWFPPTKSSSTMYCSPVRKRNSSSLR
mmetsp:Transcript_27441/g.69199  ORF Transcript_27441/g.69199 Transcript_27441/m.69199 type:complete len:249 (-) Transcript_27441:418-1164(-)